MNKKIVYTKILICFLISYYLVRVATREIFIAQTPRIRPYLDQYLAFRVKSLIKDNSRLIARLFRRKPSVEEQLKDFALRPIAKGVYAKSNKNASLMVVKENEVEWVDYSFWIKGKLVKVQMPRGQRPPSQALLEKIF